MPILFKQCILLQIAGYAGYAGYIFLYLICRLLSDKWWPGCEVKTENQNKLNSLIRFLLNQWIILVTLDTIEDAGHHSWPADLKYIIFHIVCNWKFHDIYVKIWYIIHFIIYSEECSFLFKIYEIAKKEYKTR